MTSKKEISERKSTATFSWSWQEVAVLFTKMLLKDPAAVIRFWVMGRGQERYVRPPRPYELPAFHDSMWHSTSNEKYLRPTLYCNPSEPVVIAMANELGAYEKTDYEFAEAALDFIDHNLTFEVCPLNDVGITLKRGTGSCWHLVNVFVALCRAAGIKARGKAFKLAPTVDDQDIVSGIDPLYGKIYLAVNIFALGEACINGVWMDADLVASPEMHAAQGLPITKLGEGFMGMPRFADPFQVWHFESMPPHAERGMTLLKWFAPALMERINVGAQRQRALGRKISEDAGGIEAYDQRARKKWGLTSPITELEHDKGIVFED
jgi:hypothetical protein